jgi:hypothetical protein
MQWLTMRELAGFCTRKHLVLASHNLLCQTCTCKRPQERAGKRGRETQWTFGQALRCSLHFLR